MMELTEQEKNKAFVLTAFDEVFNKRNEKAFKIYWSPEYMEHSALIPPGREGLKQLVSILPGNMRYEHGIIMAEGDYVMVHGRYSDVGNGKSWIKVDILRICDGKIAEHWDVIQYEVSENESKSGLAMFDDLRT